MANFSVDTFFWGGVLGAAIADAMRCLNFPAMTNALIPT